jgi:hypothetical protein
MLFYVYIKQKQLETTMIKVIQILSIVSSKQDEIKEQFRK